MEEKKTGALKIDWFNLKVQFSPNVNLISKKNQSSAGAEDIKESVIWFEILSNKIEKSECETYSLENDEIINTEPNNKSNPWYFDFCGETPSHDYRKKTLYETTPKVEEKADVKPQSLLEALKPAPELSLNAEPETTIEKKQTSLIEEFTKSAPKSSPPKSIASALKSSPPYKSKASAKKTSPPPKSKASPKKPISESPSVSETSTEKISQTTEEQIKNLEEQLDSTRDVILSLDKRFNAGLFNLEEYLEKKNVLIKKIETFKSQIEKLKK
ncbi:MAG: hypothetical protein EU540_02555 [Promethearchaeota archaeon]|nr:MAG: hypothetical protein EU540_02555 [Candidatus Lokiarchaeota archaeon]